jgi:tripartite-type tricarboxylate transporter receptor subunit TctC
MAIVLQPIGSFAPSPVKTFSDLYKYDMPVAGTGVVSPSEAYPRLLNQVVGTRFKIIGGYTSSADSVLAMERREVDGGLLSWNTMKLTKADKIASGELRPLVQFTLERTKDLPDTPTSVEVGRTPEERDVLRFYTAAEEVGRSFLAPPGMAPERVAMMRKAFDAMTRDAEFLDEVRRSQIEFAPLTGSELEKLARGTTDVSPDTVARAKKFLAQP